MKKDQNTRREFLGNLSKVALTGAVVPLTSAVEAKPAYPNPTPEEFRFLTAPYLQALGENEVSIMFITSHNAYSWVEYGEDDFNQKATAESEGFVDANNTLNSIRLTGLKEGTSYQYRLRSKPIVQFDPYKLVFGDVIDLKGGVFRTPSNGDDKVSCLIFNDIHDRPYSFGELFEHCGDFEFDFVALNGDMFDYQTDEQQIIDHLVDPCTQLFASDKPFIMIRGNHETRGKYARQFKDYFTFQDSAYYLSFKRGPVHWIVLDSGEDKEDDHPEYSGMVSFDPFREQQAIWLEQELQNPAFKDCKYKLVLMHIPPFHSGDWHGTTHCRKLFHPLFEKYKVDMVISGHTHRYGVHKPSEEHSYPVIIGGGPKTGSRTVIQFYADANALKVKMVRDDGEVVGVYAIS
ncbi:purple acid phosphatase family protein [Echinicola shivajiensis]|uniref:purple acid phosphatase family protein n=1 Tax=Echinicola shivajiensis TaxID=1035916 RepID=UPI001BFC1186|nr:metallophosphoesterase family protein [Echinicola shivajiensis]